MKIEHVLFVTRNWYEGNSVQIAGQTRQKQVPVFWYRLLAPISGKCVMDISRIVLAINTCAQVNSIDIIFTNYNYRAYLYTYLETLT